jgi:chromosome segregation ATPase
MSIEERLGKVGRRVKTVEEAITLLSNLLASHDDRLEDSVKDNENLEAKIAALVDAQIRSESKLQNINDALDKLTDLVKRAHGRIDRLENQS